MTSAEPLCQFLEWDSDFFGFRIGKIRSTRVTEAEMPQALDWCREQQIRCLYFLCEQDDQGSIRAAEAQRFHLTDIRLDFSCRLDPANPLVEQHRTRPPFASEVAEMEDIASDAYSDTRFYFDTNFPREKASALYRKWIARSCDGYADAVLVVPAEQGVAGFITCHLESETTGRIGLVGVREDSRGKGIGRVLVEEAQDWFKRRNRREVRVVTQGRNIAAQRLYQNNGFRTATLQLWYHRWFP